MSRDDNPTFKNDLIAFYDRGSSSSNVLKCMILDLFFEKKKVIGGHIWKSCTSGVGLNNFGLIQADIHKPRNGLLLYFSIERAFDVKEICFIYNPLNQQLNLRVLKPDLREQFVLDLPDRQQSNIDLKFKDIEYRPLQFSPPNSPFKRLLSWHAKCSTKFALEIGWINQAEADEFLPYFNLSDGATHPVELGEPNYASTTSSE